MSGPKSSSYYVDRALIEQERERRRQREEEMARRKIEEEIARRNQELSNKAHGELSRVLAEFEGLFTSLQRMADGMSDEDVAQVRKIVSTHQNKVTSALRRSLHVQPEQMMSSLEIEVGKARQQVADLKDELVRTIPRLKGKMIRREASERLERNVRAAEEEELSRRQGRAPVAGVESTSLIIDMDAVIAELSEGLSSNLVPTPVEQDVSVRYWDALTRLEQLRSDEGLGLREHDAINDALEELRKARSKYEESGSEYDYFELKSALTNASPVIHDAMEKSRKIHREYDRYDYLVNEAISQGIAVARRGIHEFTNNLAEIRKEADKVENLLDEAYEDAYVAQALDKVMSARGYRVKRAVTVKGSPRTIYLKDSGGNGIMVMRTTGRSVTMLTAGVSQGLRAAHDGVEVTLDRLESKSQIDAQVGEQRQFCGVYDAFEDDLAALGVHCEAGQRHPVDPKMARCMRVVGEGADSQDQGSRARRRTSDGLAEREMR